MQQALNSLLCSQKSKHPPEHVQQSIMASCGDGHDDDDGDIDGGDNYGGRIDGVDGEHGWRDDASRDDDLLWRKCYCKPGKDGWSAER